MQHGIIGQTRDKTFTEPRDVPANAQVNDGSMASHVQRDSSLSASEVNTNTAAAPATGVSSNLAQESKQCGARMDAQGVDAAQYQGVEGVTKNEGVDDALPPPPPRPHGLHFVSSHASAASDGSAWLSEQMQCQEGAGNAKRDGSCNAEQSDRLPSQSATIPSSVSNSHDRRQLQLCVASVQSWASATAAAGILQSLL